MAERSIIRGPPQNPPLTAPRVVITIAGLAQLVRALDCGSRGRWFETSSWYQ